MSDDAREQSFGTISVLIASLLWGTTGTAATFAPEVSPIAMGAVAMGIGGLLQAVLVAGTIVRSLPVLFKKWPLIAVGAFAVAVYPLAFYSSMRLSGVTIGTVTSIGAAPLFAALLESVLDGTRLTKRWLFAMALGLAGIALLASSGEPMANGEAEHRMALLGVILGLVAALTYALYSWVARRVMGLGLPPTVVMGTVFGGGGILLLPVIISTGTPFLMSLGNIGVGIYMACVPMFLGYLFFGYGLARVQASAATVISLMEPIAAAILAWMVVGEHLTPNGWCGVALVVACLSCVTILSFEDKHPNPR